MDGFLLHLLSALNRKLRILCEGDEHVWSCTALSNLLTVFLFGAAEGILEERDDRIRGHDSESLSMLLQQA